MSNIQKYYIQGFALVVSPGKVADADIYFRTMGHSPSISGVDLYDNARRHLGFVYPENLELETKRAMLKYIRNNIKKWHRVFTSVDLQGNVK
jgi:hypothetical protein